MKWSNLKLRVKFIIAFGLVILLLIFSISDSFPTLNLSVACKILFIGLNEILINLIVIINPTIIINDKIIIEI